MRLQWMMIWFALVTTVLVGCDENERLARYAEQAMESQHKQNEIIAQQSEQVVKESHQLAETAKELVTMDAQARSEMVQAQHDLNEGIHTERVNIDRQREDLEQERRAIATQRYREPIVAAALRSTGLIVACALPLLLAGYALWQMNQKVDESTELGNLLIDELTSPQPILLPPPSRLRLTKSESMPNVDHGNSV